MVDKKEIVRLYQEGLSGREVADRVGCGKSYALEVIQGAGISRLRKPRLHIMQAKGNSCRPFGKNFVSYVDGLLLSDGSLSNFKGVSFCSGYRQTCVNLDWLLSIKEHLAAQGIQSTVKKEVRKGKVSRCWVLWSLKYDQLGKLRERWYPSGVKSVPKDIDVSSPVLLRNWLYGDGTLVNGTTLRLCTDSFIESDVDLLIDRLNADLDVVFRKVLMGFTKAGMPKYRPALCIRDGLMQFFEHIGKPELACFKYKWR